MNTQNPPSNTKPWSRFLARLIDMIVFSAMIGFFLRMLFPAYFPTSPDFDCLFALPIIFLWVFVEPVFLSICGSTFGKWLMKVKLRDMQGNKLTFHIALKRSFLVWFNGLAMGLPIMCLFTYFAGYPCAEKTWDNNLGSTLPCHC